MQDIQARHFQQLLAEQSERHATELRRLNEEVKRLHERLKAVLDRRSTQQGPAKGIDFAFVRRAEWQLNNCKRDVRSVERGQSIWSDPFAASCISELQLEFFPQGRETSQAGFCALFLWAPGNVRLKYRLRVGNHSTWDEDHFDRWMGHGHSNFCNLEAQIEEDALTISVEILEVTVTEELEGLRLINQGIYQPLSLEASVLRNRDLDSVEWTIHNILQKMRDVPRGQYVCSPSFSVAAVRNMHMEFYPNGLEGSKSGYCGLYVRSPGGKYSLNLTLSVGSATRGPSRTELDGNSAKGLPEFCKIEEQLEDKQELVISIKVQNPLLERELEERSLKL
ncbi:Hypothetical protein SCF082_LOCUS34201 [Durusdinium trenchii]|uniref:Uncharacterized protein n=2 Tax=Durusdinium trenchii TaxID=1381693 RepID=A0ABP0NW78_9DINO